MSNSAADEGGSGTASSIPYILESSLVPPPPIIPENDERFTDPDRPFKCHRCSRRFATIHGLGGHQNGHKKEKNQERKLRNEKRLALMKESKSIPSPAAPDLSTVQPDAASASATVKSVGHSAQPALAVLTQYQPLPTNGPMVQVKPLAMAPGFIYTYDDDSKAPIFVPAGFEYGPNWSTGVVKGGEVPIPHEVSHQENQNHDQPNNEKPVPVIMKPIPLKLYVNNEEGFSGKRFKGSCSSNITTDAGPYAEGSHHNTSKEETEDLDLTLKL